MPVAVASLPLDSVKMDDRKRPAQDDPISQRNKRQAVAVNGTPTKAETEMPRDEELDRFTKDAILRQMKEYKREKAGLEQQLAQANKKSAYHDEHLRVIDGWFLQLVDELALLTNQSSSTSEPTLDFASSLLSAEPKVFQEHLRERSEQIREAISQLFSQAPSTSPEVKTLQERISSLLAAEKVHVAALQAALSDVQSLDDRLLSATTRYMHAEKQLDRARSAQVAKLEARAVASSKNEGGRESPDRVKTEPGVKTADELEAAEAVKREVQAVSQKQKAQIDSLAEENRRLSDELSLAQLKLTSIGDEEYANSELFKAFKAQHAEIVKRINDLEAVNIELREEAKTLHAERTAYRDRVDNEFRDHDVAMQSEIAQKDADLTRVRGQRDDVLADLSVRKTTADTNKESHDRFRELAEARQSRIVVLETEVERLRSRDSIQPEATGEDAAVLQGRVKSLESEKLSLEQELQSMEAVWKRAQTLASTKINEILHHEDRLRVSGEEKAKADQKYFAARKLMDAREQQFKDMQRQVSKSSEIISTLKDAEGSCRALLVNAEKQLAEARDQLQSVTQQHRRSEQTNIETKGVATQMSTQAEELRKLLTSKAEVMQKAKANQRAAEVTAEELKASLKRTETELQSWKQKALGSQSEDYLSMKKLCWCTVCDTNIKDTVLKTCKHVMCRQCVENRLALRARRCPICNVPFGSSDTLEITL